VTPDRDPKREGEVLGFRYEAYEPKTGDYLKLYTWRDGEHVRAKYTRHSHGRTRIRRRDYWIVRGKLWRFLTRRYLMDYFSPSETFPDLEQVRAGDVDEMLREQERIERRRRDRKRAADYYGKPPELVRSHEIRTYRTRGDRLAQQSFAH
jgi:hypothetical protein